MNALSLFSNCGAGDLGYKNAGFNFTVMAEIISHRLEVALLNHENASGIVGDIRETWPSIVDTYRQKSSEPPSLLAACPPCQGMSSSRNDRGPENDPDAGSKDERNLLVVPIAKVAKELQPRIIVVENVPAFLSKKIWHPYKRTPISAAKFLIEQLSDDYAVYPIVVDLADYGIPQSRKRTFLTFLRKSMPALKTLLTSKQIPYPQVTHGVNGTKEHVTLKQALNRFNLSTLDASSTEKAVCDEHGVFHSVPVWKARVYQMVKAIPPHGGKSAWDNDECPECGKVNVAENDAVCPNCGNPLLRPVVQENGGYRLVKGYRSSSYRRMSSNVPATTVTTASGHIGSSTTIHPYENRLLSPLECAFLQTFPIGFNWGDSMKKYGHTNIRRMIGEAVPPFFTYLHGLILADLLSFKELKAMNINDERHIKGCKKLSLPLPSTLF